MASAQQHPFGDLLRRYRLAADLTQDELAERAKLSTRAISDLERGVNRTPQPATLLLLAEALQLSDEERARFEATAHRRGAPSAAPGMPATSPDTPTLGGLPPVAARDIQVPAEAWSSPPPVNVLPPALQPGMSPPPAGAQPRPSGPLPPEQVIQDVPPSPPRAPDTRVTRLVRALLVGTLLAGALFSTGVAGQYPRSDGGKLCLATEFPTTETGDWGPWAISLEHAVQVAVQQNQALGNGYTLETIHYHEVSAATAQRDPQLAARNVTDMVQTPCILGMVGPAWSRVAVAEMPIIAKAGLVMISPANTMPALTVRLYAGNYGVDFDQLHPAGKKTNYFRTVANDAFQGLELAAFTSRQPPAGLGARSAFVVDDHTPYGEMVVAGFTQEFLAKGGAIVGTDGIPFGGAARIAELAARIVATRSDVVCYGGTVDGGGGLLKAQLAQAGYTGLFVGGDGITGALDPAFIDQVGTTAASDVFAINPVPDPSTFPAGAAARFVRDYHAKYPGEYLDGYSANAYDAAMLLITAIKRLISTGQAVTRQAVRDQVQNIQYVGVTGPISFDHNGDNAHGVFSVYTVQDGKWVWVKQLSV